MALDARIQFNIQGLQAAQAMSLQLLQFANVNGPPQAATQSMAIHALRWVISQTHVATGTLRAARRAKVFGLQGIIFTDEVINPRTGKNAAEYDVYEQMRGGKHATFSRAYTEAQRSIVRVGMQRLAMELP